MSDDNYRPPLQEAIERMRNLLPDDDELCSTMVRVRAEDLFVVLKSFDQSNEQVPN